MIPLADALTRAASLDLQDAPLYRYAIQQQETTMAGRLTAIAFELSRLCDREERRRSLHARRDDLEQRVRAEGLGDPAFDTWFAETRSAGLDDIERLCGQVEALLELALRLRRDLDDLLSRIPEAPGPEQALWRIGLETLRVRLHRQVLDSEDRVQALKERIEARLQPTPASPPDPLRTLAEALLGRLESVMTVKEYEPIQRLLGGESMAAWERVALWQVLIDHSKPAYQVRITRPARHQRHADLSWVSLGSLLQREAAFPEQVRAARLSLNEALRADVLTREDLLRAFQRHVQVLGSAAVE